MQELTQENYGTVLGKGDAIIDCWAPWCAPCRMFAPVFEASAAKHPEITYAKLNTDEYQEIAGRLGIRGIPTLIFFRDGQEIGRQVGALPAAQFEELIRQSFG